VSLLLLLQEEKKEEYYKKPEYKSEDKYYNKYEVRMCLLGV
jgi:hypothetical protein